jgi:hypothetical protein
VTSCSSVKKTSSQYLESRDSTSIGKKDSGHLVKSEGVGVSREVDIDKTLIDIEFDSSFLRADYPAKAQDYMPVDSSSKNYKKSIRIKSDGKGGFDIDLGNNKPVSIKIQGSGTRNKTDSNSFRNIDTSFTNSYDSIHATSNVTSKRNSIKKTRILQLMGLGAGIALVICLIGYIRRKRKQILNP